MDELASRIRGQLESLTRSYEQHLSQMMGHVEQPQAVRWDTARHDLGLIADCLEDGDSARFTRVAYDRARERREQGGSVVPLVKACSALEDTLLLLDMTAEEAKFLWRMFSDVRDTVLGVGTVRHEQDEPYATSFAEQVRVAVQVFQELAGIRASDELFRRAVILAKERFGYYHVQILRYEPALQAVVLLYGYGSTGEQMLSDGYSVPMGEGVVGMAASTGQSVLVPDIAQVPGGLPTPHLPGTRAELAVPIKLRDLVLGILDVHSDVVASLGEDDRLLLEFLTGSVALIIEATTVRQEMEESLRELRVVQQTMSGEGRTALSRRGSLPEGYLFDRVAVRPASDLCQVEVRRAMESRSFVSSELDDRSGEKRQGVGVAPIVLRDQAIGALGVYQDSDHPLSTQELELVQQVAEQVAVALENARFVNMTRNALSEARMLYRVGELLSAETDLQAVYGLVSRSLVTELGYATAYVGVLDEEGEHLLGIAGPDADGQFVARTMRIADTRDIAAMAVRQRSSILTNDMRHDERFANGALESRWLGRAAAVPILAEGEMIGVISASCGLEAPEIDERDVRLLEAVAVQSSSAIQRVRLLEQTQEALSAADAATRRYVRDSWDAFLEGRTVENQTYVVGPEGMILDAGLWLPEMDRALERGETVLAVTEPNEGDGQPRCALAVPLKARGQIIGVVDFDREGTAQGWTQRERELIEALVEQIGESIESERQFAQTQAVLAETERMYEASQRISATDERNEILQVVVDIAASTAVDQVTVFVFERPVVSGVPDSQEISAFWDRSGRDPPAPVGTRYTASEYPLVGLVSRDKSFVASDVQSDQRLDGMRDALVAMGIRALAAIPMSVGNEWLGYSVVAMRVPHVFSAGEMRVYESVNDQAATALRSARLYREAQSRARREQLIREIISKMRGPPDLDTILKTAVKELGSSLGVSRAFVRLSTGLGSDDVPEHSDAESAG